MELPFSLSKSPSGSARKRGSLVPFLVGILLLQGCFYLGLRLGPAYLAPRLRSIPGEASTERIMRWRQARYVPERDPAVGMELPALSLPARHGRKVSLLGSGQTRTLLVFLPEMGCSARSLLTSWGRMAKAFPSTRLVGVTLHSPEELQLGCHADIAGIPVVQDADAALARILNASWRPRAYLLDRSGRVQYVQPITAMDGAALLEVERRLGVAP